MSSQLSLQIDLTETPQGWRAQWSRDDQLIGGPITVHDQAAKAMADLGRRFLELFEQGGHPLVDPEDLRGIGRGLFATWFAPAWSAGTTQEDGPGPRDLIIRSADRRVLNLPWELVELAPGLPVGCDAAWSLRRSPVRERAPADGELRPGPLRIAFLAASPIDQAQLDFEREEDAMLRATARLPGVAVQFAELGSFAELADLVAKYRPHVVHLSGHGEMAADGQGKFAFEDERGRTDWGAAADIVAKVFRGSTVRCVVFNGCQTSQADAAGLCQSLVGADVPLTVGWSASVADDRATEFTAEFYRRLVLCEPVPTAAAHAREVIRCKGRIGEVQDATFALLQVYSSVAAGAVFDPKPAPEPDVGPHTEYVLLGDGIKGLREGFVGRRRERQRLVPALRDGDTTFAVITGIGGAGKSTLATRAANRLATAEFQVVPVRVEGGRGPLEAGRATLTRLIGELDDAFIQAGRDDLHRQLTDGNLPLPQRLRLAVKALNDLPLAVVIDNFEDALELETRRIADPDVAELYRLLATNLTRGSCVIITCRYLPEGTPTDLPTVLHLPLPDLDEPNFLKFLRRDEVVDDRIGRGELAPTLIHDLYRRLGGTPGFLENLRRVLRTADPDALIEDLEGDSPGALSEARESYYQRIIANRLYETLPGEARGVVSRLAISELPLPIDAARQITGADEALTKSSLEAGVAFGLLQRFDEPDLPSLYHPPGVLRRWLSDPARLPEPDALIVHQHFAAFWRSSHDAGRETELRVTVEVELWACRSHAERGDEAATFQWSTVRLAWMLDRRAEWSAARALLQEIPEQEQGADCLLALAIVETSLGEWKAARFHLQRAQQLLPDGTSEEALTWHQLATIDVHEGDYAAARPKFTKALDIRKAIGDRAGEAVTRHNLAAIDLNEGHYAAAREKIARALEINQAIGNRAGEAATWRSLSTIDVREGDYAAARPKVVKALEINQAIGDRAGEAAAWHGLAGIDVREGDYAAAREKFAKALEMRQVIGNREGEAATLHDLGAIDFNEGHYAAARERFDKSLQIKQAIGDREGEAATLQQLAVIDRAEGHYAAAREKFDKVLATMQAIGHQDGEAAVWHQLAKVDLDEDKYAAAREKFDKALQMRKAIGDRPGEADTWQGLAMIDLNEGDDTAAREKLAKALQLQQAIGDRAGEAATWHGLATIDLNDGHHTEAREKFTKALQMQQAIGDRSTEAATWHNLAVIDFNEGHHAAAREKFTKSLEIKQAIADPAGEAATLHNLAAIDLDEDKYAAAREKFAKALEINQAIGGRAGESATWHQLATIDVHEGDHAAAREKFHKALEIKQAIGDRAGEAQSLYQIGFLAHKMGRGHLGARLVAICFLIDQAIGHGKAESDFRSLSALCSQLGYDQAQFDAMLTEARAAYQGDRGRTLIERALPDGP
jgi:tetratricopeptide (TPR) repeat protein